MFTLCCVILYTIGAWPFSIKSLNTATRTRAHLITSDQVLLVLWCRFGFRVRRWAMAARAVARIFNMPTRHLRLTYGTRDCTLRARHRARAYCVMTTALWCEEVTGRETASV